MLTQLVFVVILIQQSLGALNWDPGLTKRLAAYWNLNSPNYFELCPDSPNGECRGTYGIGGGFYTLSYDADASGNAPCIPNTDMVIPNTPEFSVIAGQICPYRFYWGNDGGVFGRIEADTKEWSVSTRIYIGLQENQADYGGWPPGYSFPAWNYQFLDVEFRNKVCYSPNMPNLYAHGQIFTYITFHNPIRNRGMGLRFNFIQHLIMPAGSTPPDHWNLKTFNEADIIDIGADIWNLNGYIWGFTPNDWVAHVDTTPDCSYPMESVPWRRWRIDLHSIYREMMADGHITQQEFDAAFQIGSIVGGVESWGQSAVVSDVKGFLVE